MPSEIDSEDIEALKYKLELEKFQWEKATHKAENRFLNRHFGVAITTIVSVAAIIVSFIQLTISSDNVKAQIDNDKLRNDRQFYLEASRFLLTYESSLRTRDLERLAYFRDVVVFSYPPEIAKKIATAMMNTSRDYPAAIKVWEEGLKRISTSSAPISK